MTNLLDKKEKPGTGTPPLDGPSLTVAMVGNAFVTALAPGGNRSKIIAGRENVDVVYGPDDEIVPCIFNIGDTAKVDLKITIKTFDERLSKLTLLRISN